MSKIYAKWNDMKRISVSIGINKRKIVNCAAKVNNVRNSLRMSDDVNYVLKSNLRNNKERIEKLANDFGTYSSVLNLLADSYKSTEEKNKNR